MAANAVSQVGHMMTARAVPWLVLETTGSPVQVGLTGAAIAIGAVAPRLLGGPLVDRLGPRRTSVAADLVSGVTVATIALLQLLGVLPFWLLLVLVFVLSSVTGQGESGRFALIPGLASRASMSLERSNATDRGIARAGQLIGPLLAGVLIPVVGVPVVLLLDAATFAFSAAVVFLRVPLPQTVPHAHRTALGPLLKAPAFAAALVLMGGAGASELTMSQWSSLFAERGLGLPKVWGDLAGPCMFAVLMGFGRVAYGLWGAKMPLVPALVGCGTLATACYLTAALSHDPVRSLVGCALCGLAVSLLWPGTFSLAAARFPLGGAAMFGVLAVFGDTGAAAGPWLAGAVADAATSAQGVLHRLADRLPDAGGSSLRAGLLIGTMFPLSVVATALVYGIAAHRRAHGVRTTYTP